MPALMTGLRGRTWAALTIAGLGAFVVVAWSGPSAAQAPFGAPGWAPPALLPWHPGPDSVTLLMLLGYLLGGAALLLAPARPLSRRIAWGWPLGLGVAALLSAPIGTSDPGSYAAYGQIHAHGGDPWLVSPAQWRPGVDPVTTQMLSRWQGTASVYGPVAVWVFDLAARLGQDSMRQIVWCWQVVVVLAWLLVRWLLLRLASDEAAVDTWWTFNPLVVGTGVLGAHVDILATLALVVALAALARWPGLAGGIAGLAVGVKVTATLGVVALAVALLTSGASSGRRWRAARFLAAATAVAALVHLGNGWHVVQALKVAADSRSRGSIWALLLRLRGERDPSAFPLYVSGVGPLLLLGLLALAAWSLTGRWASRQEQRQGARCAIVVTAAYILAAPYALPWYDQLIWASLPVMLVAGPIGWWLRAYVSRALLLAVGYLPGIAYLLPDWQRTFTSEFRLWGVGLVTLGLVAAMLVAMVRSLPQPRWRR